MKFQCPCGAKFAFDIAPEMVQNPVKFVCPTCGLCYLFPGGRGAADPVAGGFVEMDFAGQFADDFGS